VLLTGAAFAGGAVWGSHSAGATSSDRDPYAMLGQVGRVLVQIENNYVDPVDRTRLVEGSIKGMIEELDPHSQYMPPQDFSIFQSETEGQFGGVGIEVESRGDLLTVIAPIEGSPAERAGIKSGDLILAIDGEDISRTPLDKLIRRMRGTPGSHIRLAVRRSGENDPLTFDLIRQVVHVPSVASRLLDNGVAYVRVKQFQEHTHDELLGAAAKLRAQAKGPLTGVVLDLRNDPGGLVDEAAEIADEFLESGTIYTTRHRGQIVDEVKAAGGGAFSDLPTVVLVNEYSASAAELLAGALQDPKRALVVGANTFGKGSVQTIIDLPGGAGIRLTTARYYTPSGHSLQAEGIHPDILVELNRDPAAASLPTLHERDLEGHLSAQASRADAGSLAQPVSSPVYREPPKVGTASKTSESGVDGSDAHDVPRDPSDGSDFALRIAYRALRGTLAAPVTPP
jgi:carboxyl-terminal processing protease